MEFNEVKQIVESGNFLKSGASYKEASNSELFSHVLNDSRYLFEMDFRLMLCEKLKKYFSEKNLDEQLLSLVAFDKTSFFASYFYSFHDIDDGQIKKLLSSENERIMRFGQVLAIGYDRYNLVHSFDDCLLTLMFENVKLSKEFVISKYNQELCSRIITCLNSNHELILNDHLSNLTIMIDVGYINTEDLKKVVVKYFVEKDYLFQPSIRLFESAIKHDHSIIDLLTECRLLVDPFSCSTNFSRWLIDIKKHQFIFKLIENNMKEPFSDTAGKFIERQNSLNKRIIWHNINR